MNRSIFIGGTVVLLAAAALLWWIAEQCIDAVYAGSPVWGLMLILATASGLSALLFLVAFIHNIIDLVEPVWAAPKSKGARHDL